jgi:hypothetical protein
MMTLRDMFAFPMEICTSELQIDVLRNPQLCRVRFVSCAYDGDKLVEFDILRAVHSDVFL